MLGVVGARGSREERVTRWVITNVRQAVKAHFEGPNGSNCAIGVTGRVQDGHEAQHAHSWIRAQVQGEGLHLWLDGWKRAEKKKGWGRGSRGDDV